MNVKANKTPSRANRSPHRHRLVRRALIVATSSAVVLAVSAPSGFGAQQGTTWIEREDAGPKPSNAQLVVGTGPLGAIVGSARFNANMFKICAGPDFRASVIGGADFDTQLFLFDRLGVGLYANDDAGGTVQSRLPAGHPDGPNIRGEYYLAISPFDRDPVDGQLHGDFGLIFPTFPFDQVHGRFTDTGHISGWQGGNFDAGDYRIVVNDAEFLNRNGRCVHHSSLPIGATASPEGLERTWT